MAEDLTPTPSRDITRYSQAPEPPYNGYPAARVPDERGSEIERLLGIASRHRWLIVAFVLVATGVGFLRHRMATPIWEARASVRIQDPETPSVTNPQIAMMGMGGTDEIETEMQILRSYAFAEAIVDSLDLQLQVRDLRGLRRDRLLSDIEVTRDAEPGRYVLEAAGDRGFHLKREATSEILARAAIGEPFEHGGFRFTLESPATGLERIPLTVHSFQGAVGQVAGGLSVYRPLREVSIIEIRYRSPDPGLAAAIPNAYAERYLVERRKQHRTEASSTVAFLREQIDTLAVQLLVAEEAQKEFQEDERVVALDAQGSARIGQIAALEAQRDALASEQAALGQLLRDVQTSLQPGDAASPFRQIGALPSLVAVPTVSNLLSTLTLLENERSELMARRTPQDPDVQTLQGRIEEIEGQLHSVAQTYHRGLSTQIGSLNSSLGRNAGTLSSIPRQQVEMARLQRETQLLQHVYTLLQTRLKEAQIAESVQDPSARIVDRAAIRGGPVEPKPLQRSLMFPLALGALLGVGAAYLLEWRDRTVHTRDEVKAILAAPVVGLIPRFERNGRISNGKRRRLAAILPGRTKSDSKALRPVFSATDHRHAVTEAFRSIRTNITFTAAEDVPRTILLVSALPGDGKTTASVNLAAAFARQGLKVLVVDADMRRGVIHSMFDLPREPGLSDLLIDGATVETAIRPVEIGPHLGIDVLPTGTLPPNPSELLAAPRFEGLLERLRQSYDHIVIDTPPITLVTDAMILAGRADSVLMVVRSGHTEEEALRYASEQLFHVGISLKGAILNDVDMTDRRYGGYHYRYGYKYSYYVDSNSG